jgi:hypothetical protein
MSHLLKVNSEQHFKFIPGRIYAQHIYSWVISFMLIVTVTANKNAI